MLLVFLIKEEEYVDILLDMVHMHYVTDKRKRKARWRREIWPFKILANEDNQMIDKYKGSLLINYMHLNKEGWGTKKRSCFYRY